MESSSHPLVFSDQKRPMEGITGDFNVLLIFLGFHTPELSRKKLSLMFYVWFEFRGFFSYKKRDETLFHCKPSIFTSHSRRQVPSSLTNFLYIIKGKTLLKKILRSWWVARRDYLSVCGSFWERSTSPSLFGKIRISVLQLFIPLLFSPLIWVSWSL